MTAKTITFAVQAGSGGFEIARLIAEALKYRYYDWEVTEQAAREAGVEPHAVAGAEQAQRGFRRVMERLLASSAYATDRGDLVGPDAATMTSAISSLGSDAYRHFIERVVQGLGESGEAVIVGHAGQVVLRSVPAVLKILVCGSQAVRSGRLANKMNMDEGKAKAIVSQSDRERIDFFREVYRVQLLSASLYDLTVNTDTVPIEAAVELILATAKAIPGVVTEAFVAEQPQPDGQPST